VPAVRQKFHLSACADFRDRLCINDPTNYTEVALPYESAYSDAIEVDFSILEAVGLIRRVSVYFDVLAKYSITLKYYHLTYLGFVFADACGIIRDIGVKSVSLSPKNIFITLTDDREYTLPLNLFPGIQKASVSERAQYEITYISIRWPKLGEEISVGEILEQS
jgi:hypothetical protein